jgi:hypothetical protein
MAHGRQGKGACDTQANSSSTNSNRAQHDMLPQTAVQLTMGAGAIQAGLPPLELLGHKLGKA